MHIIILQAAHFSDLEAANVSKRLRGKYTGQNEEVYE